MMSDVCTWDEVFTRKKKSPNLIFLILYWYLFNRSDYQSNIVKKMGDLKKLEEFKDIPDSIVEKSDITKYIGDMEKYNLVGIKKNEGNRKYYQSLSFFYLDPFCVKTPELRSCTIGEHYKEYRNYIEELGIAIHYRPGESVSYFNALGDNSVIPAQRIVQDYSSNPEKFMRLFFQTQRNYMALYDLIREAFSDVDSLLYYYSQKKKENITESLDLRVLDIEKAPEILDYDRLSLIKRYDFIKWYEGIESSESIEINQKTVETYWREFCGHPVDDAYSQAFHIMSIYTDLQYGRITFNREKLRFDGRMTYSF